MKKLKIVLKNKIETIQFDGKQEAAAFLNMSITAMTYNEKFGKTVKGWEITFLNNNDGCCVCGGVLCTSTDEYCTRCYYIETTGKAPEGESKTFGAKQPTDIILPFGG